MANKGFYTSVERFGNMILERGYDLEGKAFSRKVKFSPSLYVTHSEGEFQTLGEHKPARKRKFDSISEASEFIERYTDVDGYQIYGMSNWVLNYIQETYPDNIDFDFSLINLFMYDIEVDISKSKSKPWEANEPITAFSIKRSTSDRYHLLGLKEYYKHKTITGVPPDKIDWEYFDSEEAMIRRFIEIWATDYPDIVTGWNVDFFDISYTISRIVRLFGEETAKRLSPWGNIRRRSVEMFGREQITYSISGISIIDYMDAFKKFGHKYGPQASYKLDSIANVVLGEKKIDYSEYGNLAGLYEQNPHLFYDYALKDTVLIKRMEDTAGLVFLATAIAYRGGVNYSDAFGTVTIWESILYRRLMTEKTVPPVKGSPGSALGELIGGYVKEPVPGMYDWVLTFDLDGLYPNTMSSFNMGPDTIIKGRRVNFTKEQMWAGEFDASGEDYTVCANGVLFDRTKRGIIPRVIDEYYAERKQTKINMLKVEQEIEEIKEEIKRRKTTVT